MYNLVFTPVCNVLSGERCTVFTLVCNGLLGERCTVLGLLWCVMVCWGKDLQS